jgi:alkylhydroperoxidase family enzyme
MKELLKDIAEDGLSPEVCGNRAQKLSAFLLARTPHHDEARTPTDDQHVRGLVDAARCHASNPDCFDKILCALSRVSGSRFLQDLEPLFDGLEDKAVAQCCTAIGDFAKGDNVPVEAIVKRLLAVMESFQESVDVQEACTYALVKVWRPSQEVLGLQGRRQPATMQGVDANLRKAVVLAASKAVRRSEYCAEQAVRLLARAASLKDVLNVERISEQPHLLHKVLDEVIYTLEQPLSAIDINDPQEQIWARDLLCQIGAQRVCLDRNINVTDWVYGDVSTARSQDKLIQRFTLAGLLFGAEAQVLIPMADAVAVKGAEPKRSAELMSAACRALISLNDYLVPFGSEFAQEVAGRAMAAMERLKERSSDMQFVRSSYAGLLGTVGRRGAQSAARGLHEKMVEEVLWCAQTSMGEWWNSAALFHEILWALGEIFDGAHSLGKRHQQIQVLTRQLDMNFRPQYEKYESWEPNHDVPAVMKLCSSFLSWGGPGNDHPCR